MERPPLNISLNLHQIQLQSPIGYLAIFQDDLSSATSKYVQNNPKTWIGA